MAYGQRSPSVAELGGAAGFGLPGLIVQFAAWRRERRLDRPLSVRLLKHGRAAAPGRQSAAEPLGSAGPDGSASQASVCSISSSASSTSMPSQRTVLSSLLGPAQHLHGAQILRAPVNRLCLGPAHRMRAARRAVQVNFVDPTVHHAGVLPGPDVRRLREPRSGTENPQACAAP
jgi:hypothetical protein